MDARLQAESIARAAHDALYRQLVRDATRRMTEHFDHLRGGEYIRAENGPSWQSAWEQAIGTFGGEVRDLQEVYRAATKREPPSLDFLLQ